MKLPLGMLLLLLAIFSLASELPEAPTGFDNKTNGLVDDATHLVHQANFEAVLQIPEGLGPLYNASPAANATRTRFPARPPRSRYCASVIMGRTDASARPTSRSLTELK